jgi:hypothetical protein
MISAKDLWKAQLDADMTHQADRIKWLEAPLPKYSCGTPVAKHDILQMLRASKAAIAAGMVDNSARRVQS